MEAQWQDPYRIEGNHNLVASRTRFGHVLIGRDNTHVTHETEHAETKQDLAAKICRIIAQIKRPITESTKNEDPFEERQYKQFMHEQKQNEAQFQTTKEDELPGYSKDDRLFFQKVVPYVQQRQDGMLQFPLPFTVEGQAFAYNKSVARNRTKCTLDNMRRKHSEVFQSSIDKFNKNIQTANPRFVQTANESNTNPKGCAYWIPIFSVWQKQKARLVFNAAAKTEGKCLNDTLLQGPDRNNSLRGVLLRFRRYPYAVTADIENMFHQIAVPESQTTYMRFFWFRDNDPEQELVEYRSNVHLMGLNQVRPSPTLPFAMRHAKILP
jgi:hypothetical protein